MLESDLMLYLVTDRKMAGDKFEEIVETAIKSGVTMVQLREKQASFEEFCEKAIQMKKVCDKYNIPLIINDSVEVCLAVDAAGVHLGSCDCDIAMARKILGNNKIIGASARDLNLAKLAEKQGADYLGVGAVFGTTTKQDAKPISLDILKNICDNVNIPVVAIGGVSIENMVKLNGSGIAGIAVISSILKAKNVSAATQDLKNKLQKIIY